MKTYIDVAESDIQQVGHVTEATWAKVLGRWLPDGYRVGTRKYIVPELNDDEFETDIVVFKPLVPRVILEQTRVPHGAVAAAFSVKRTLNRAGLEDAVDRGVRLRRSMDRSIEKESQTALKPAYIVGVLASSHSWRKSDVENAKTVTHVIRELDRRYATVPSEALDLCCISQLGTWKQVRAPWTPLVNTVDGERQIDWSQGVPMNILLDPLAGGDGPLPLNPVGQFIRDLYSCLEDNDPQLREFAYSLRKHVPSPSGTALVRHWHDLQGPPPTGAYTP
ncbi:MAG: DUF6602 domain-containing protein [Microthrixaceae bacterium]